MLSLLLAWHVLVVFMAPLSLQPKTSQLAFNTAQSPYIRWYTEPLYLNGGYAFFSPDPPQGGSLIRYKVYGDAAEPIAEGEFPNRNNPKHPTQWPRLWYHRQMMLVDQGMGLSVIQPSVDGGEPAARQAEQQNIQLALRAYARHLLRKHEGLTVELDLVAHDSLHPEQARAGADPTDPSQYRPLMKVVERSDQLEQPLLPEPPPEPLAEPAEVLPIGGAL